MPQPSEMVEGPCKLIRRDEILKAVRTMKKDKAAVQELYQKGSWLMKIVMWNG